MDIPAAIQIETGIVDVDRLKVLLSKTLSAFAVIECEVDRMSNADIASYLYAQRGHSLTIEKQ